MYILTGRPRNRADRIDYSQQNSPRRSIVELMVYEDVSEALIAKNLCAIYIWIFARLAVTYEDFYGRCICHESHKRQCTGIGKANRRLKATLGDIREHVELPVEGNGVRFDDGLAYR